MTALALTKEAHVIHSAAGLQVDEATRPELVDFGTKVLRSENVRQNSRGANEKRNGFVALGNRRSDGTFPTVGYKAFAKGSGVVRITDAMQAEMLSPATSMWGLTGRVPEVGVATKGFPLAMSAATLPPEDIAIVNGYLAVMTRPSTNTGTDGTFRVLDAATLAPVVGTAGWPRTFLASYGTTLVQVYDSAANTLSVNTYNTPVIPFVLATYTVGTDFSGGTGSTYACCNANNDRVAIAYVNNSGGTSRLTVKTFNSSGAIDSTTINTSSTTPDSVAIACFQGTGTLFVAWNEGTAVKMIGYSPSSLSTISATTATVLTGSNAMNLVNISPGSATFGQSATSGKVFCNSQLITKAHTASYTVTAGAVVGSGAVTLANVAHTAKPFFSNGRHYALVFGGGGGTLPSTNTQGLAILVDFTDAVTFLRPVANIAPGLALTSVLGKCAVVPGAVSGTFITAIGITRSRAATGGALVTFDFNDTSRWQAVAHAGTTALTGALVSYFDGVRTAELGFLMRPITTGTSLAGTGLTGTFRYVAVYEEVDGDGNWCISGVSDPTPTTSPANQTVTTTWAPLAVTARTTPAAAGGLATNVRIAIYRTLTGAVAPFYRVGVVANDTTTFSVPFADAVSDTTLAQNAQLYEQPSIVGTSQDRRAPPNFQAMVSYNGMLVGASGSDVWYSGQAVGGEAVWFNPVFQIPIPGDGDITGLAALDGTLFVFKRRDIFALAGDPPADNGSSGGLGAPRRIASDVGCIEPRSTCTTSLGIFFQSDRGIEILTRAQSTEWIGEPYTNTVSAFPICTSITVEPVSNTALVELAASQSSGAATGGGCTLVYDLSLKQWVSKDIRLTTGVAAQSACIVTTTNGPRYGWMSAAGQVYTETPNLSLDAGAWVTSLIETASVRHGLQQRQRVWGVMALFEHAAAAGLQVEIAYDYAGYSETKAWTEAETLSGLRQLEFRPKSEHAAIRFRISDTAPAVLGTGQGLTLIGLSVDAALKQGATKGTPHLSPTLRK